MPDRILLGSQEGYLLLSDDESRTVPINRMRVTGNRRFTFQRYADRTDVLSVKAFYLIDGT